MLSANETRSSLEQDSYNKNNPLPFAEEYYFTFILIFGEGLLRYNRKLGFWHGKTE